MTSACRAADPSRNGVECEPVTRGCGDQAGVSDEDVIALRRRIIELQSEHRELDEVVTRLGLDGAVDQLQLTRMKKRKLLLKDQITRLKSRLIPDLDA